MNFLSGVFADSAEDSISEQADDRVTLVQAALSAYGFLFRQRGQVLRALILPVVAAGLVLYTCLGFYLSELLSFLGSPNPRVASLALGTLAAGFFLSLFFYAMAVVAVSDLVLGRRRTDTGLQFRAERQEWRVYAAYLRLLLVMGAVVTMISALSIYAATLVPIPPELSSWFLTAAGGAAIYWLFARIGFLIAPVVAGSEGTVLRRTLRVSARHLWRNCGLIVLLLLPGLVVQVLGEFVLRAVTGKPLAGGNLPLEDSARLMGDTLAGFLVVGSLSVSISIVLLTAGALAVYRIGPAPQTKAGEEKSVYAPSLARSVLVERLPK